MDKSVVKKEDKLVEGKLLELVCRRFFLTFWSSLAVSGGVVAALWPTVERQTLLAWLAALWLIAGVRQFHAKRYLALGQEAAAEQGKWLAGMVLGAVAGGACWGSIIYFFPATPHDATTMLLLFVIAGVTGFASVTMAAVPLAAAAFIFFALLQPALWLISFGAREYYFMAGVALAYLALMVVYVRQMHNVIRGSLTTSEQNKELAAALGQVKALEHAAAQKENEQRYRELFANFEDNIVFIDVVADGQFSVASLNPAAERTFGMRDADARGKSKLDLFPAELAARLVEYDIACVESGRPLSYEDVLELPSGKRYFSVTQIPMRDESGKVYRIAAISRDITERKQMEEALAAREREFRALVENAPDPIFRYDRECRRVYANQTVTRMTGIPLAKLLGQTPTATATIPSAESVKVQQSVQRVLDTGVADDVEVLFVAPDGSELTFQMLHVPEFAADGSVQGVLSMGRDITARKYMAGVLQKSEREYRMLAENAPDNIVRYDRDCRIRYLNKKAEASLGMPAGYLAGKTLAEVFSDGLFDGLEAALKEVIASGQGRDYYQTLPDTGNGERYHHLLLSPELDEQGVVSGALLIGRDITERKQMEEQLVTRERQFRTLAESTPDPIYRYDRDCRRIYVNPAVTRITGKPAAELLGSQPADGAILVSEQHRKLMTKIRRVFDSGEAESLDIDYILRDGARRDYQMMLVPERDDSGAVVTVLGIARDVTDLRDTERRLSQFVANVPGYVYTYKLDADGRGSFLFASPGIEALYGVTPEEVADNADALRASIHPDDAARMDELLAESARSLTPYVLEHRVTHPVKGERWLESRAAPQLTSDGIQWHGMTMDITERKQAESALAESGQLLRNVLQGIPDPVWMKDAEGAFVVCNEGVARLFNMTVDEIIGKDDYDFFPPEQAEFYQNKDRAALEAGRVLVNEEPWTFGDNGEQALMETRKTPVRSSEGKLLGVLGVARDITSRKQMETQLANERATLRTFFAAMPSLAWMKDSEGRYLACNPLFEQFFGAKEADIVGKTDFDFVDAELAAFFRQKDQEAEAAGKPSVNEEWVTFASDGRRALMETVKSPVTDAGGKVIGIIGVAHDITERKQAQTALQERGDLLQAIMESSPEVIVFALDTNYRYLSFNRKHQQVMQAIWGKEIAVGMSMLEVIGSHADGAVAKRDFDRALSGESFATENAYGDEALSREYWQTFWSPTRSSAGEITGLTCFVLNISERRRMESALQDNESMLQEAQRIAHVGSWDVDMVNDKLTWSDEIFRIWEIDKTKFKADFAAFVETVHPEDRERVVQVYNDAVINHSLYEVEHRLLFPDGRVKHILERGEPQYDATGKPVRFIGTSLEITERKRLEEELQLKERALDQAHDAVYLIDEQARFVYVNDEACRALGYSREELLGMCVPDIDGGYRVEDSNAVGEKTRQVGSFSFETQHRRRDGSLFPVEIMASALDYKGKHLGLALARDISERKLAEAALAKREREFRSLAGNIPDNIARWDTEGRYLYVNSTHERLLGMKMEDLIGKSIPDSHEHVKAGVMHVVTTGQAIHAARQAVMVDGVEEVHDVSLVPEFDDTGKVVSVLGMGRNMTERYRMLETIAARELEFRSLAENMPDSVVRWDSEGRYTYINPTLAQALGTSLDEIAGKLPSEAFPDRRYEPLEIAIAELLASGEGAVCVPQPVPTDDGQMLFHEVNLVVERNAAGEVTGVLGIGRDVTEHRRMQETLAAREQEFRSLAENMPDNIARWDRQGRYLYINPNLERLFGGADHVIGKTKGEAFPDGRFAEMEANILNVVATGKKIIAPRQLVPDENGEMRLHDLTLVPEFDAAGQVIGVLGIGHDMTDIYRMQEALAAREQEFRSLAESSPDFIIRYDRDGRIRYLNSSLVRELGLGGADEVIGKRPSEIWPDGRFSSLEQAAARAVETGEMQVIEMVSPGKNGAMSYSMISIVPERDTSGNIIGTIASGRDVTVLRSTERMMQMVGDHMPGALTHYRLRADLSGELLYASRGLKDIYGFTREDLADGFAPMIARIHPDDLPKAVDEQEHATKTLTTAISEFRVNHPEKGEIWVQQITTPVPETDGSMLWYSLMFDITERKRMEEALVERQAFLDSLFEAIPVPVFYKDRAGRYLGFNRAYETVFGASREQLIGKSVFDTHPKELAETYHAKDAEVFERRVALQQYEYKIKNHTNGELRDVLFSKAAFTDARGEVNGLIGAVMDITERKQAERQLKETLEFSEGVINAIPDLLFEVDRDGRYLNVWAQNAELLAAQKELLLGNTINEMLSPEAAAVSMAAIREAEEKGLSLGKTMRLDLPQGASWFELSVSRKSGGTSSDMHFLVLSRDVTERKLAEVALRASEALAQQRNELLQAIVESSPEIIVFALDTNYRYLSFNQKHKQVMQAIWGKEIAVGESMLDVIGDHPDRKSAQSGMDRALAGESFVHEEAYGDEALSRQYWQNYWSPIRSDAGKVVGLTCFVLNITERKKAEEAVRESGAKLRSLFELSPLGIALTDMQGRYVEFNESFRAICGYPADELMTLDYWTLTPRQYEMQEIAQLESLAKTGRYGPYEKEYRQKDGTLVPIQLVGTLITGKDGRQHIWSIVEDISERKRTEAELKERLDRIVELNEHLERTARDLEDQTVELEAQAVELEASQDQIKQTEVWYRSILHSSPDGLLVVDARGFIMLVNERLEEMFGYGRGELQGLTIETLIPQAARERHVGLRNEFIAKYDAYRQAAKTLFGCRKDGSEFPVDVSLSRLPEVDGMRSAICASVRDISERHAMEAAREAALAEVQHLAQLRGTFMAQMSHELRTPLNGILGYAQNLLQGEALGEKQTTGLRIIQNSGEHLLTLINGILDHAAIEADKFELIPGDIELEPFLSTLIGMIRVRAEQKNLAFVCDADAGLPAVVRGDAQRLRQVLLNLLSNAVKFTDKGQVTLRVTCPAPSRMRFAVQDSGVGIVPEQLETIFIPFEQGGEVSRRAGGTGLGLSISRKLVRLMGGDIKVESRPGEGCIFSFEIDMAAVDSGAAKINVAALSEQAVTRVVQASSQLLAPPRTELDVLHGSALRGNMREVIKHADRFVAMDSRYQPFAEQLRQLAKGFQTKALLALIEQYRDKEGVEQ